MRGAVTAAGEGGVGDLMEALRLSSVKAAAEGGGSGGGSGNVTDRAPVASTTARGKLMPLATPSTRPTTSTAAARNRRKLSAGATTLGPEVEEVSRRGNATNDIGLGLTTSPVSPKKKSATTVVAAAGSNANNGGIAANSKISNNNNISRTAARGAAAARPGKASLAWQHPVDKIMSTSSRKIDHEEAAGRVMRDGQEHHGGPWAATESVSVGGRESYR